MVKRSLARNFVYNTALLLSNALFPLVAFPYVARVLGPDSLGKFNLASVYAAFFVMLATFGIPMYGIREIAKARNRQEDLERTFSEVFLISIATSLIAVCLYFASVLSVARFRHELVLYTVFSANIIASTLTMDWLYSGLENYGYIATRSIVVKAISVASLFVFVRGNQDYVTYAIVTVGANSGSFLFNLWNARKYVKFRWHGLSWRRHLKSLSVFFLAPLISSIYNTGDTVLLGFLKGNRDVAFYNAAKRFVGVSLMVSSSLSTVIVPRLSHLYSENRVEYGRLLSKSFRSLLLICFPAVTGLALLAQPLLSTFGGPKFAQAYPALAIQSFQVLLTTLCTFFASQVFIPTGNETYMTLSNVAGAVTNLALNVLLIPKYGYIGASVAVIVSDSALLIASMIFFGYLKNRQSHPRLRIVRPEVMRGAGIYLVGSALVAAAVVSIRAIPMETIPRILLSVAAGASVYAGFLLLLRDELALELISRLHRSPRSL